MTSKIILKKSSVAAKAPVAGDLVFGELAINYTDSKLYFKKADGSIDAFTTAAASAPVTSVGGNIGAITDAQLLASIKNVDGAGSGLDADFLDGLSASSFYLASNPNGYTNNTGTVTSVGATAPLVSSGGTAPSISIPAANSTTNGYMSSAYAAKLDGIAAGATNVTNTNQLTNGAGYITSAALGSYLPITGGNLTTGASNNLFIGRNSTATNYNAISLNGNPADSSNMGLTGGGVGDNTLYVNSPGNISVRTGSFSNSFSFSGGSFTAPGDVRAPIFYDSNDTGYYIDPSSYSRIRQLTLTQARVDSSKYPVGHYAPGEEVFAIDPTWTQDQIREYFNSNNVSWVADSTAPGGYAIQLTGAINVGGVYGSGFPYIPVETDDTFYMEVYIKNVTGSNAHYMGSMDFNHNFSNLGGNPGSFGYWVMSNSNPGTGWTKYSGYISGFGTAQGQFVSGTEYWTPQALFNYSGGGTSYISGWKVLKLTKGIVGRFPNSTVNTGEAWYGRANDRNRGTYTIQLGGGSSSGRQFEVVDYAWSSVMFRVSSDNFSESAGSSRAPIFYDNNDTGYYVDPNSTSRMVQVNFNNLYYAPDTNYGFIGSSIYVDTINSGYANDQLEINYVRGTWAGISHDSLRAPLYYDYNDTAYYTDQNSTSSYYRINVNNNILFTNYGRGMIGTYASTVYQAVFAMGDSYKLPDNGSTTGNLYGLAWSHPNAGGTAGNLNTHGLLVLENGGFLAAVSGSIRSRDDMRSPIFYDSNDTGYNVDPNGTSNMNALRSNRYSVGNANPYDAVSDSPWYGLGQSNAAGPWGPGMVQIGGYYGIRHRTAHGVFDIGAPGWGTSWIYSDYNLAVGGQARATIYYDYSDTGYYADPNGDSRFNRIRVGNGASSWIDMLDDESPNGVKYIHANSNYIGFVNGYGGWAFRCDNSGNTIAEGNVTAYSDERLKRDWLPLPVDYIERLAQTKSGTYTRIDSGERQAGSSAQDWQKLLPEVVTASNDDDKTLALAYGNAALVSAIELAKRVVEQDARIEKLEERLSKLLGE